MNCPAPSNWDLLASKALETNVSEPLLHHAAQCPICHARLQHSLRAHVDRVRMYEVFDRDHDRLREEFMSTLPDAAPSRRARFGIHLIGDLLMNPNLKTPRRVAAFLAPAACLLLALAFFTTSTQKSAFAAAIDRLRDARTIVCHFKGYLNGSETAMQSGVMYLSNELGMRFDAQTNMSAFAPGSDFNMTLFKEKDGPVFVLQPTFKIALKMNLPEGLAALGGPLDQSTPDAFFASFRKLTGEADKSLGRSVINGVEAEGFEVSARKLGLTGIGRPAASNPEDEGWARLWVNARDHTPIQMELMFVQQAPAPLGRMQIRAVMDQMEFNRTLDPQLFVPQVPDDFRVISIDVPERTEQTLIAALKMFSDVTGRYPTSLDPARVSSASAIAMAASGKIKVDPNDPASIFSSSLMRDSMTVAIASNFVQTLQLEGRNPGYFGEDVGPQDANSVLLQWALPEGGTRVIYGDLRAVTIHANGN